MKRIVGDFTTIIFLSVGRISKFKKVAEILCKIISIAILFINLITFIWENFRTELETLNKLRISMIRFKREKLILPSVLLFSKSNYEYDMIVG